MKAVYVYINSDFNYYLEQLYISVLSLKLYNPAMDVVVVTDSQSESYIVNSSTGILNSITELIVVELSSIETAKTKSRLLKTSIREYIKGDYIYIDCDTVILQPLSINHVSHDLMAVYNTHHPSIANSPFGDSFQESLSIIGEKIRLPYLYNGGVLYSKDTPKSHAFYKLWNFLYQKYKDEYNITFDQLSLYMADYLSSGVIGELAGEWNCQLGFGVNHLQDAKIIHFLTTAYVDKKREDRAIHILQTTEIYNSIRENSISKSEIEHIVRNVRKRFLPTARISRPKINTSFDTVVEKAKGLKDILFLDLIHDSFVKYKLSQCGVNISKTLYYESEICRSNEYGTIIVSCDCGEINHVLECFKGASYTNIYFIYR